MRTEYQAKIQLVTISNLKYSRLIDYFHHHAGSETFEFELCNWSPGKGGDARCAVDRNNQNSLRLR